MKKSIAQLFLVCALLTVSCRPYDSPYPSSSLSTSEPSTINIKTSVKISVGGVIYENLDARLRVSGYDATDMQKWTNEYDFVGPEDTLTVRSGFDHYSIELLDKWGVYDQQSVPGKDLYEGRVGQPVTVTYSLAGNKQPKRLTSFITSREVINATGTASQTESRTLFTYSADGLVETILRENFNRQEVRFEEESLETFTYQGRVVSAIEVSVRGQRVRRYDYVYGAVNTITETNFNTGITTTQAFTTHLDRGKVTVNYRFSTGAAFLYEFGTSFKNIVSDQTIKEGQLCNTGDYSYDKYINPFRHLGYTDFNLQNWSANNRVSEKVDFIGCSYPTLIPLSYAYNYDMDGYPVRKITTYQSNTPTGMREKVNFFYE